MPPKKRTAQQNHTTITTNNSSAVKHRRGRPPKADSLAIEAKKRKYEVPVEGNRKGLAVASSNASQPAAVTTTSSSSASTVAVAMGAIRTTISSSTRVAKKPHKRTRAECDGDDNDYQREEDINEEITLEQLGRMALRSDGHQYPVLQTLTTTTTTTTTAAAEESVREQRSPSAASAAPPSLMLTPLRAGSTSPEHLTSSSGRNTSILLSVGVKGERRYSQLSSHNVCETILHDSDDNCSHGSSHDDEQHKNNIGSDGRNCSTNNARNKINNNNYYYNINNSDHNDQDRSKNSSITLSPAERPSTTLIRRAAATRPAVSPATLWIYIDDDDNDDDVKVFSSQPSPARREPIAEVLPPTFRARKGPLQADKPPPRALSPLPDVCLIYDDDITEEDEEGDDRVRQKQKVKDCMSTKPIAPPPLRPPSTVASLNCHEGAESGNASFVTLPFNTSQSYIKDDDNSSVSSSCVSCGSHVSKEDKNRMGQLKNGERNDEGGKLVKGNEKVTNTSVHNGSQSFSLASVLLPREDASVMTNDASVGSPTRSVRDFLFSSRRQTSADWGDSSFNSFTAGPTATFTTAATTVIGGKGASSAAASVMAGTDALEAEFTRPVEKLRPLFHKKFTRKSFLNTAENVVSKLHCLEAGEFWQAFETAEYVGEGSFGIVWRCRTVDGDLVAVKSCPISFHSRGSIDDAFSVLREIAIMRFLSEHEVPYILPLHSAFFVQAREALPPAVVAAVEWKSRLAEEQQRRQQQQQERIGKRGRKKLHFEHQKRPGVGDEVVNETPEELQERLRHEKVRLPRFLSISVEDAMKCDATVFLVTELCDGDLESIERHDGITKGVAFCVSSALAAMHQLGLVHLDLKPSNILFAYENSPSQQYQIQRQQQQQQQSHYYHSSTSTRAGSVPSSFSLSPAGARTTGVTVAHTVKFYLSDFGNCRIVGPDMTDEVTNVFGTIEYMDIRALQDKTCSRATDCFSLGATLYELLYSRRLYPPCKNPKCLIEEDHTRHCYVEAAQQPVTILTPPQPQQPQSQQQPSSTSPSSTLSASLVLQKVMTGLLALDPLERWTADRCRSFFLINGITSVATTTGTAIGATAASTP